MASGEEYFGVNNSDNPCSNPVVVRFLWAINHVSFIAIFNIKHFLSRTRPLGQYYILQMAEVIDIEAPDPIFDANLWIGKGKKYPEKSIPFEVSAARNEILSIPQHVKNNLPNPHLSIAQFIQQGLPPQSSAINTTKISRWFSKVAPSTYDVAILMARPIPPQSVLVDLDKSFGQQWFDGAQSICDPRFNNGTERLPLWVLTLWKELARIVGAQAVWRKSEEWLNREARHGGEGAASMKTAIMLLTSIRWDAPVSALGSSTTTAEFSRLLRTEWISDELLNMMMEDLSFRA